MVSRPSRHGPRQTKGSAGAGPAESSRSKRAEKLEETARTSTPSEIICQCHGFSMIFLAIDNSCFELDI